MSAMDGQGSDAPDAPGGAPADRPLSSPETWEVYNFPSPFVEKLTKSLASPAAVDKLGNTLHMLCAQEGEEALSSALKVDGRLNTTPNALGDLPVHAAAAAGCGQSIRLLKKQRYFHVNARNNNGDTPLMTAVQQGRVEAVRELLTCRGVELRAINRDGDDCLSLACMLSNATVRSNTARPPITLALLEAGADVSHTSWGGLTSGQLMAVRGGVLGLWMMLCYGADPAACERVVKGRDCKLLLQLWQQRRGRDIKRGWECLDQLSWDIQQAARAAATASGASAEAAKEAAVLEAGALLLAKRLHEEAVRVGLEVCEGAEGQTGLAMCSMHDLAFYEQELEAMTRASEDVQAMAQVYSQELDDEVRMVMSTSEEQQPEEPSPSDHLKWAKPRSHQLRREPPLPVDRAQLARLSAAREQRLEMEERLVPFQTLQAMAGRIKVTTLLDKRQLTPTRWRPQAYSQLREVQLEGVGEVVVVRAKCAATHASKLLFKVLRGQPGIVESFVRLRSHYRSDFINIKAAFDDGQHLYLETDAKGTERSLAEWCTRGSKRVDEVYRFACKLVERVARLHSCGLLTGHLSPALVFMHHTRGPLLSCVQAKCDEMPPAGATATGQFSPDIQNMGGVLRSMVLAAYGATGPVASRQLALVQAASAYCLAATTPSAAAVLEAMRMRAPSSYLFAGPGLPAA